MEEAALALVVERPRDHPPFQVPEPRDARPRAVDVAASPPRVRFEERGVRTNRRGDGAVDGDLVQRLLDLGGIAAVPLLPDLADGEVRERTVRLASVGAEAREARQALAHVRERDGRGGRDRDEEGEEDDQTDTSEGNAHEGSVVGAV